MNPQGIPYLTTAEQERLRARTDRPVPAHIWEALDYEPNMWSYVHAHTSGARFNAFATSRQVGKSTTIKHDLFDALFEPPRADDITHHRNDAGEVIRANPNVVGVISDTFDHAELVVVPFIALLDSLFGPGFYTLNKNQHVLRIVRTGAELRWFSAESPRAGQGYTFSRVYIDEAQNVEDEFWVNLRPALGARMARVFAFGTPDPVLQSSWFEGLFLRGQSDDEPDYYSYSVPCTLNKWLPALDVRDAAASLSDNEFRMKYLGQWVKGDGAVFRNPETCFKADAKFIEYPEKGRNYVMGLDLAKHDDFTVAYIADDKAKQIVHRWRINHLDYVAVADHVAELYKRFKCRRLTMDVTGVGEPVYDMLRQRDLHINGYLFTGKSKEALVSTLAREIEHKRLILPMEDKQLLRELQAFTRTVSKAGNVQYSAPVNYHDDTVMALGLTVLAAQSGGSIRITNYLGN